MRYISQELFETGNVSAGITSHETPSTSFSDIQMQTYYELNVP
jgi:hypothetical protein